MKELEPVPQPIPQVGQVLTGACLCSWQNREKGVEGEGGVKQQAWSRLGVVPYRPGGRAVARSARGKRELETRGSLSSSPIFPSPSLPRTKSTRLPVMRPSPPAPCKPDPPAPQVPQACSWFWSLLPSHCKPPLPFQSSEGGPQEPWQ